MKNSDTSLLDIHKLNVLIAAGIKNVTVIKNGIAFNGKIPLCLDEQSELNEKFRVAEFQKIQQVYMEDRIYKRTEIIKRANCARDIAKELVEAANQFYLEFESDKFSVIDVPYVGDEIKTLLAVLGDLAQYAESQFYGNPVSEEIAYLSEFVKDEEESEAEAA